MKLIYLNILISCLFFCIHQSNAQIVRTNIVEHFTNTSCGICASRNPVIHNVIRANTGTLHISFHPSVPYSSDFFNKQNKKENDDRTIFYDVFYGTPVVVLNGIDINDNQLPSLLAQSSTSNYSINIVQSKITTDSFTVTLVIKKVAADYLTSALLFVGVLEDTIQQSTNNGEKTHYNVFRKSLSKVTGDTISLPLSIGDSVVHNFSYVPASAWQKSRLHTIGILQHFDREVINSAKSINIEPTVTSSKDIKERVDKTVFFPNPFVTSVSTKLELNNIKLYSITGQLLLSIASLPVDGSIDLSKFSKGTYYINGNIEEEIFLQKIIKN